MNCDSQVLYHINADDEIIFVNNEWLEFAFDANAPHIASKNLPRHNLWDLISDEVTKNFYRLLLRQARAGYFINFKLRRAASKHHRLINLTVSLGKNGDVEFGARSVWLGKCQRRDIPEMNEVIVICSWCNKIKVDEGDWQEIDESLKMLGLFDFEIQPPPSHGMCDECYKKISAKFKK